MTNQATKTPAAAKNNKRRITMPKKKTSSKSSNKKNTDEFRKLHTKEEKGHLHYVCGKKGKNYESVGITHAQRTKGINNIPRNQNPDKKDKEKAYVRPKLTEKKSSDYGKRLDGLGLVKEDKEKVWALIEKLRKEKKTKK